jgi:hypothetical protein
VRRFESFWGHRANHRSSLRADFPIGRAPGAYGRLLSFPGLRDPVGPRQGSEHRTVSPVRASDATCRRSTATSWRTTKISASLAASLRARSASQPSTRTMNRCARWTSTSTERKAAGQTLRRVFARRAIFAGRDPRPQTFVTGRYRTSCDTGAVCVNMVTLFTLGKAGDSGRRASEALRGTVVSI